MVEQLRAADYLSDALRVASGALGRHLFAVEFSDGWMLRDERFLQMLEDNGIPYEFLNLSDAAEVIQRSIKKVKTDTYGIVTPIALVWFPEQNFGYMSLSHGMTNRIWVSPSLDKKAMDRLLEFVTHLQKLWDKSLFGEDKKRFWTPDGGYLHIEKESRDHVFLSEEVRQATFGDYDSFMDKRERLEKYPIRLRRSILLVGPPGSGKTKAIRAIATNSAFDVCFWTPTPNDDNRSLKKIAEFVNAPERKFALLVIEDLESVMTESRITRSEWLNFLSGVGAMDRGYYLIASTNNPQIVAQDPAMIRSSRFDRIVNVGYPALNERVQFIDYLTQGAVADGLIGRSVLHHWAKAMDGLSLADCEEIFTRLLLSGDASVENVDRIVKDMKSMDRQKSKHDFAGWKKSDKSAVGFRQSVADGD